VRSALQVSTVKLSVRLPSCVDASKMWALAEHAESDIAESATPAHLIRPGRHMA
jgi:hypothetical protein